LFPCEKKYGFIIPFSHQNKNGKILVLIGNIAYFSKSQKSLKYAHYLAKLGNPYENRPTYH
jgi:hypothetical protein